MPPWRVPGRLPGSTSRPPAPQPCRCCSSCSPCPCDFVRCPGPLRQRVVYLDPHLCYSPRMELRRPLVRPSMAEKTKTVRVRRVPPGRPCPPSEHVGAMDNVSLPLRSATLPARPPVPVLYQLGERGVELRQPYLHANRPSLAPAKFFMPELATPQYEGRKAGRVLPRASRVCVQPVSPPHCPRLGPSLQEHVDERHRWDNNDGGLSLVLLLDGLPNKGRRASPMHPIALAEWRIDVIGLAPRNSNSVPSGRQRVRTWVKVKVELLIQRPVHIWWCNPVPLPPLRDPVAHSATIHSRGKCSPGSR